MSYKKSEKFFKKFIKLFRNSNIEIYIKIPIKNFSCMNMYKYIQIYTNIINVYEICPSFLQLFFSVMEIIIAI